MEVYGCNLFKIYIKPQLLKFIALYYDCCNLFKIYIKPQPHDISNFTGNVVIYLKFTSNHNAASLLSVLEEL